MITKFLHTGIEVKELDEAIESYLRLGFTLSNRFDKPEPKAHVASMKSESGTGVELWQFLDHDHPQVEFIRRHIAVSSTDLPEDLDELTKNGFEVVIPITKGVILTYAFVRDKDGNFIEIAQG